MSTKKKQFSGFKAWLLDYYAAPSNWRKSSRSAKEALKKEFQIPDEDLPSERTIRLWRDSESWSEEIYNRYFKK